MDTLQKGVGIDLMKIISLSKDRKGTQSQLQQAPTQWTRTDMLIQEPQTT
jgi:hypothetical protein